METAEQKWSPRRTFSSATPSSHFKMRKKSSPPYHQSGNTRTGLRKKDSLEGYGYLKMYKRKYCPYAHLLYGKGPELRKLNLDEKYQSEAFDELNIAVNYETEMFHVYRTKYVIYEPGFEKVTKGN